MSDDEVKHDEQYRDCQGCGEPVDTLEPGNWKAPNDELWWHEECYDKVEKAEEIREQILTLIIPEGEFDGLSDEFHRRLDNAQDELIRAVERERLKREQGVGHYGHESDRGEA